MKPGDESLTAAEAILICFASAVIGLGLVYLVLVK